MTVVDELHTCDDDVTDGPVVFDLFVLVDGEEADEQVEAEEEEADDTDDIWSPCPCLDVTNGASSVSDEQVPP